MNQDETRMMIALTTEADLVKAETLAMALLQRKVAACVNLRGVDSLYWWEGKLERGNEIQLLIKTNRENLDQLCKFIEELHSYETPEIIFWPVSASKDYSDWVESVFSKI